MLDYLLAILYGVVEGITEWLPISSTGHLIILETLLPMQIRPEVWSLFLVIIQLGAIMATVILFWQKIWPFRKPANQIGIVKKESIILWLKVALASIPGVIFKLLHLDEICDKYFYNGIGVAVALITFGVVFIIIEHYNKSCTPKYISLSDITFELAAYIGLFQILAAAFPGTSRSGATIIGALILGVSRTVAAEFTFFLAIPVMFGASLLKLVKFGFAFTSMELIILLVSMVVAFAVSVVVIRFLMGYIRKHDFKVFGWYRIALGIVVLAYFFLR